MASGDRYSNAGHDYIKSHKKGGDAYPFYVI